MFKDKRTKLFDSSDTWDVAEGTDGGKPIFIRYRTSVKEAMGHPQYPYQIGIAVPLTNPTADGLPTNEEGKLLNKIEDELITALSSSILVLIITTDGMREFVFYEKEWQPEKLETRVKKVNKSTPDHKLQFIMRHDPSWSILKPFI